MKTTLVPSVVTFLAPLDKSMASNHGVSDPITKTCLSFSCMVSSMVLWNTNQKVVKRLQNICIPCDATVFENQRKSRIQHCERSELRFYFEWTKVHKKCQK